MGQRLVNVRLDEDRDLEALMAKIFEQYPDPPDLPAPEYNLYDPAEARDAIRRRLRRRRRVRRH